MHHPKLLRSMSSAFKCIKTEKYLNFSPIMSQHHGYWKGFLQYIPSKSFWLFLYSVFFLQLNHTQLLSFRAAPRVPVVPKVKQVSSISKYSNFSLAPKVPFAPKARFAPRAPSPKFPPRVKRVVPPSRPKPTRLVPFVKRVPLVQRPKPVRVPPKRLF